MHWQHDRVIKEILHGYCNFPVDRSAVAVAAAAAAARSSAAPNVRTFSTRVEERSLTTLTSRGM